MGAERVGGRRDGGARGLSGMGSSTISHPDLLYNRILIDYTTTTINYEPPAPCAVLGGVKHAIPPVTHPGLRNHAPCFSSPALKLWYTGTMGVRMPKRARKSTVAWNAPTQP